MNRKGAKNAEDAKERENKENNYLLISFASSAFFASFAVIRFVGWYR